MATYINLGQLTIDCDYCNQQVFTIYISDPPFNQIKKPFLTMCNDCKAIHQQQKTTIITPPPTATITTPVTTAPGVKLMGY
jgi:hypothetical protein